MPQEKKIKVYCTAPCLDGKGGTHKSGDSVEVESKSEAQALLATGRFSEEKPIAKK